MPEDLKEEEQPEPQSGRGRSRKSGAMGMLLMLVCTIPFSKPLRAQWSSGAGGTIYYTYGRVGIGTTAPESSVEIANSSSLAKVIALGASDGSNFSEFALWSNQAPVRKWELAHRSAPGEVNNLAYYHYDGTTWRSVMEMLPNGYIGIGTISPQYLLSVNGTIGAREVIVTNTGWSDYVFEPQYQLMPLSEVGAYIKEHRRLPGVPSEEDVRKNGIGLGVIQAKLLAKIEELTLYMIEAREEISRTGDECKRLERENGQLKERLAHLENGR